MRVSRQTQQRPSINANRNVSFRVNKVSVSKGSLGEECPSGESTKPRVLGSKRPMARLGIDDFQNIHGVPLPRRMPALCSSPFLESCYFRSAIVRHHV